MSEFKTALDLVHSALRDLHERGVELRASAAALHALQTRPPERSGAEPKDLALSRIETGRSIEPPRSAPPSPGEKGDSSTPLRSDRNASDGTKAERLAAMCGPVLACMKCSHLVKSRTQVVFGVGNPDAELIFVGEAPGEDEDRQGEPFVGKAGQLLTKIIETMGFARDDVYIANVLKCRPDMPPGMPGNRKPKSEEMQICLPYLREQIHIIQPKLIVALGATAMEGLTGSTESMSRLRGRWHDFQGTPLMATYHPAYLLRNQSLSEKRKVWEDMLMVLEKLGRPISEKQRGFFLAK